MKVLLIKRLRKIDAERVLRILASSVWQMLQCPAWLAVVISLSSALKLSQCARSRFMMLAVCMYRYERPFQDFFYRTHPWSTDPPLNKSIANAVLSIIKNSNDDRLQKKEVFKTFKAIGISVHYGKILQKTFKPKWGELDVLKINAQ